MKAIEHAPHEHENFSYVGQTVKTYEKKYSVRENGTLNESVEIGIA